MKRDPRLHALSSDHHHALVLARRLVLDEVARLAGQGTPAAAEDDAGDDGRGL